jgi:hypothetical protein
LRSGLKGRTISRPSRSEIAVEKLRLELRICEYEVRSIASPISSAIAR